MNNNFDFTVKDITKDTRGNFIIMTLLTMDKEITLVNVYGPNNDKPQFYERLQEQLTERQNPNIIIAGDWNLLLNPSLDYCHYKHVNNPKAQLDQHTHSKHLARVLEYLCLMFESY